MRSLVRLNLVAWSFILFCSCQKTESVFLYGLSLNEVKEIALKAEKDFCLVLVKGNKQLEQYKHIINNSLRNNPFIFNFIDIELASNHWYQHLVGTNKSPITLVFKNNNCRNIVFGTSKYAMQSIKNTRNNIEYNNYFGFYENSILQLSEGTSVFVQQLLELTSDSIDDNYLAILNESMKKNVYPYNLFMKIKLYKMMDNKDSMNYYTHKLLSEFQNPEYSNIYSSLFKNVKEMVGVSNCLIFTTDERHYNCKQGDTINIYLKIENNNSIPVEISKIETSCECLSINDHPSHSIPPRSSKIYTLSFSSKEIGTYYREIYVYSDAEVPIDIIGVNINVK